MSTPDNLEVSAQKAILTARDILNDTTRNFESRTFISQVFNDFTFKFTLVDLIIEITTIFPDIAQSFPTYKFSSDGSSASILHILIQSFLMLNYVPSPQTSVPLPLFHEMKWNDKIRLFKSWVPLEFPSYFNFWHRAFQKLNFYQDMDTTGLLILEVVKERIASYDFIRFCLINRRIWSHIQDVTLIWNAVILGPIEPDVIENFANSGSAIFRRACRSTVNQLIQSICRENRESIFEEERQKFVHMAKYFQPLDFDSFKQNMDLISVCLSGYSEGVNLISVVRAKAIIREFMKKRYLQGSIEDEHLHEVLWIIVVQRPFLRTLVVSLLRYDFNDDKLANEWEKISLPSKWNGRIFGSVIRISPHELCTDEVGLPNTVNSVQLIRTVERLNELRNLLREYASGSDRIIGIDSEWSPYTINSRISIVQIAIRNYVFIIDAKVFHLEPLSEFFEELFGNNELLKIGFDFSEDVKKLKFLVPTCSALYRPCRLVCMRMIIQKFLAVTLDIAHSVCANATIAQGIINSLIGSANKYAKNWWEREFGLAILCERALGKKLNKTEQCSVWDRNPLRPLQLRYAAIDAYTMLVLYDKCMEWARSVEVDLDAVIANSQVKCKVPLLCVC